MKDIKDRVAHLYEQHKHLDKQIDEMSKHTILKDYDIEVLKKKRLQVRDEIAILEQQQKKATNE